MKKSILVLGLFALMVLVMGCAKSTSNSDFEIQNSGYKVAYTYNVNNKSSKAISIVMVKYTADMKLLDKKEYVVPAKSAKTINFEGYEEYGKWWYFGWVNMNGGIGCGNAQWWANQKEIVIDEEGWLTYEEDGIIKRMSQVTTL